MKLAYLISAHRYPDQLRRLVAALHDPANYYVIHMDRKAGSDCHDAVRALTRDHPNVAALESERCTYGGYSLVNVTLRGIAHLVRRADDWGFFINLSGQDFPLRPQAAIRAGLEGRASSNFLAWFDPIREPRWNHALRRIQRVYVEVPFKRRPLRVLPFPIERRWMIRGSTWFGGEAWMTLNRASCEYLALSPEVTRYRRFFRNTKIPDESFFQTVILNSRFRDSVINDHGRYIDWTSGPEYPRVLRMEDVPRLERSPAFFVRKVDATVDGGLVDWLERRTKPAAS